MSRNSQIYPTIKRALDIGLSAILLVVLSPVLLLTAIAVWAKLGRPLLFTQNRPGKNQRIFKLYKFRSMSISMGDVRQDNDSLRLSRFGSILRATSLDELPSLWNIFVGDMSFVGPRPLLVEYLPRYSHRQQKRHQVRPGLTGLAQSSGRNLVPWAERLELDAKYVENISAKLDFHIICKTVAIVFTRVGTTAPGHATMPEFTGENLNIIEREKTFPG
jgi:lipopolysaccharide/colanic/teichoic acid biosynthesis glycosyltransferase